MESRGKGHGADPLCPQPTLHHHHQHRRAHLSHSHPHTIHKPNTKVPLDNSQHLHLTRHISTWANLSGDHFICYPHTCQLFTGPTPRSTTYQTTITHPSTHAFTAQYAPPCQATDLSGVKPIFTDHGALLKGHKFMWIEVLNYTGFLSNVIDMQMAVHVSVSATFPPKCIPPPLPKPIQETKDFVLQ
eukprot:5456408-Amphidinium_carterae.1